MYRCFHNSKQNSDSYTDTGIYTKTLPITFIWQWNDIQTAKCYTREVAVINTLPWKNDIHITSWGISASCSCCDKDSLCSTLVVPTSTGRPILFILDISTTTARHFPVVDLKTTSDSSWKASNRISEAVWYFHKRLLQNNYKKGWCVAKYITRVKSISRINHRLGRWQSFTFSKK